MPPIGALGRTEDDIPNPYRRIWGHGWPTSAKRKKDFNTWGIWCNCSKCNTERKAPCFAPHSALSQWHVYQWS